MVHTRFNLLNKCTSRLPEVNPLQHLSAEVRGLVNTVKIYKDKSIKDMLIIKTITL